MENTKYIYHRVFDSIVSEIEETQEKLDLLRA